MVDFEAGAGYSVTGNQVHVDFSKLQDGPIMDALAEVRAVAKDRGFLTESAASIAVANSAELVTPELLIATVDESGAWYTKVVKELNDGRKRKDKVQVVPEDELAGRAAAWLNTERQKAIEGGLTYDEESPVLLLAVPNTPVSREETVQTWANAHGGKLWQWSGRLAFLEQWSADQLSGFNPDDSEEPVRFVAIETGYDEERAGNQSKQRNDLVGVRGELPIGANALRPASLFEGGILANRYSDQSNPDWRDTYVHAIELQADGDGCVPYAGVGDGGRADVGGSHADTRRVSRRLVG